LRFLYNVPLNVQPADTQNVVLSKLRLLRACVASAAVVDAERGVEPLNSVHSLSLRTTRTPEQLVARFRRDRKVSVWLAGVGIALLVALFAAALLFDLLPRGAAVRNHVVLGARVLLPISIVCIVASAMGNSWLYRIEFRAELRSWGWQLDLSRPAFVEIEFPLEAESDAAPMPWDVGYVICAPLHRRIVIEGFIWRLVIRAEDVLSIARLDTGHNELLTPDRTLRIRFRVASDVELVIGLQEDTLRAYSLRKYFGREPLFDRIEDALALRGRDAPASG